MGHGKLVKTRTGRGLSHLSGGDVRMYVDMLDHAVRFESWGAQRLPEIGQLLIETCT